MTGWRPEWPAHVVADGVGLRPLRYRDAKAWLDLRQRNIDWLSPWDATAPTASVAALTFRQMVRRANAQARAGESFPWAVTYDEGRLVGQLTVSGIVRGSAQYAHIGYWIDAEYAGRGIIPTAVAMAVDHCIQVAGLHRIEINIRPENRASLRVVEKLGFRPEGLRPRYLHIDGAWRDHLSFAITAEEIPEGMLARWRATRR